MQGYVSCNSVGILIKSNYFEYVADEIFKTKDEHKLKNLYNLCIFDIKKKRYT